MGETKPMRCSVCDNNLGYCTVSARFSLTDEEAAMTTRAWTTNNYGEKCLFWGKGKKRKTHEEVFDVANQKPLPNL